MNTLCNVFSYVLFLSGVIGFELDGITSKSKVEVCRGQSTYSREKLANPIQWLKRHYPEGCTHVHNHLVIRNLTENDDISFLQNIEEVNGLLIIEDNEKAVISLPKLKVVRGSGAPKYENHALMIRNNISPNGKIGILDLSALRSVTHYNILVENNKKFCFLDAVDWTELLEDRPTQTATINSHKSSGCPATKCSPSCQNKLHCWGSKASQCQEFATCSHQCSETRRCSHKTGSCCSTKCAGGCITHETNCLVCRGFTNGTACLHVCPPRYITVNFQQKENPDFRFIFGAFCVKTCPAGYLEFESFCIETCPTNHYVKDGKCTSCRELAPDLDKKHQCKNNCHLTHIIDDIKKKNPAILANPSLFISGNALSFTWKSVLKRLKDCIQLQAKEGIVINSLSASHSVGDERVELADLYNLRNLTAIYGSLKLNLKGFPKLRSLDFLQNLEILIGGDFVVSEGSNLQYLGLNRIRKIEMAAVKITRNPKLCYMEYFRKRLPGTTSSVTIQSNANNVNCRRERKICSSLCNRSDGCWGPGREMCISCSKFRVGHLCVKDCDDVAGYYLHSANSTCLPCDQQCINCTGPRPNQCIGKCRNVKEDGVCREKCNNMRYLNKTTGECLKCSGVCVRTPGISGPACSGPLPRPGPQGCNNCKFVEIVPNKPVVQCHLKCPHGYFKSQIKTIEEFRLQLKGFISSETKACRPCHQYCSSCIGPTEHECIRCKTSYFKYHDASCVARCPPDSFLIRKWRYCKPCHEQCHGCTGSSQLDCKECVHVRIFINETAGAFNCSSSCPPSLPRDEYSQKYDDRVCFPMETVSKKAIAISVGSLCGFIGIVIIMVIILICMQRRRAQLLKERELVQSQYSRRLEDEMIPLSKTDQKPNYSQLTIISAKQLVKGQRIGTGMFGTVYKGKWTPEIVTNDVEIQMDVAIKELKSSDNASASKEFLSEAHVMASVNNPYCVHLLGVSLVSPMKLVSVFVPLGNLTRYMPKHKSEITSEIIMTWALQIAKGMDYLESKGIVHRDLAARNVLLQNIRYVRITDFGLAKLVDPGGSGSLTSKGDLLPVQWLAIECLQVLQFSHKSDVWAYGVTLWEILTFASQKPYGTMKQREIIEFLERGERLEQPRSSSNEFYLLLLKCWVFEEDGRPTFEELVLQIREMMEDPNRYISTEEELRRIMRRNNSAATDNLDNTSNNPHTYLEVSHREDDIDAGARIKPVSVINEDDETDAGGYLLPDRFGPTGDDNRSSRSSNPGEIAFAPQGGGRRKHGYMAVSTEV